MSAESTDHPTAEVTHSFVSAEEMNAKAFYGTTRPTPVAGDGERWEKSPQGQHHDYYIRSVEPWAGMPAGHRYIAYGVSAQDADRIVADHNAALAAPARAERPLLFYREDTPGWVYANLVEFHMPLKIADGAYADEAKLRAAIDAYERGAPHA